MVLLNCSASDRRHSRINHHQNQSKSHKTFMKITQLRAELLFLLGCWHPRPPGGAIEAFLRFEMASQTSLLLEFCPFAGSTKSASSPPPPKEELRNGKRDSLDWKREAYAHSRRPGEG